MWIGVKGRHANNKVYLITSSLQGMAGNVACGPCVRVNNKSVLLRVRSSCNEGS